MTRKRVWTPAQREHISENRRRRWKSEKYRYYERVLASLKFTEKAKR